MTAGPASANVASMWREVVVHAVIDQPVERVFPYLVNPLRWREFAPACVVRRPLDDGVPMVGARWESADRIGPFTVHFIDELAELEPGRRVVWLSSAPWNARVEYLCQRDGTSTRIRATYGGSMSGWLRTLALVPRPVMGWILAQDFRRLRGLLAAAERRPRAEMVDADVQPGMQ